MDAATALVAYATTVCQAVAVEVHTIGVTEEMVTQGDAFRWSGDPCDPSPVLRLSIEANRATVATLTVRPSLSVWVDGWVAPEDVAPGDAVTGEPRLVRLQRGNAHRVPGAGPWQAVAPLVAGEVLTRGVVRAVPDAVRGTPVQVRVVRGGVTLKAEGRLLQDGALGEPVRVRNQATQSSLQGVLVAPDIVEIR